MAVLDSLGSKFVVETPRLPASERLHSVVQQAITHASYSPCRVERRRDPRYPYPRLIRLSAIEADGITPCDDSVIVVGKHLSARGIDFFHREPLPHRRMIAWLETDDGVVHPVLVELLWCRFTKEGWYDNGGRLLRVLEQAPR